MLLNVFNKVLNGVNPPLLQLKYADGNDLILIETKLIGPDSRQLPPVFTGLGAFLIPEG